jgi:hypothetical protein
MGAVWLHLYQTKAKNRELFSPHLRAIYIFWRILIQPVPQSFWHNTSKIYGFLFTDYNSELSWEYFLISELVIPRKTFLLFFQVIINFLSLYFNYTSFDGVGNIKVALIYFYSCYTK